jgi:hypothetical protein
MKKLDEQQIRERAEKIADIADVIRYDETFFPARLYTIENLTKVCNEMFKFYK